MNSSANGRLIPLTLGTLGRLRIRARRMAVYCGFAALGASAAACSDSGESTEVDGTGGTGSTASGGAGTGGSTALASYCEALGDKFTECFPSEEPGMIHTCDSENPFLRLREEFVGSIAACIPQLTCDEIGEYLDYCAADALEAANQGQLDPDVLSTCESTSACEESVRSGELEGTSTATARCLESWVACKSDPDYAGPFYSEDHCLTIMALTDASREAAAQCLDLVCEEQVDCLRAAGAFNF